MKEFLKEHPVLSEATETMLAILSGSFAIVAVIFMWVKEILSKRKK